LINQSVIFSNKLEVNVHESPVQSVGPKGLVLVRTTFSAISAGTELLVYKGEIPSNLPLDVNFGEHKGEFQYPTKYGYSVVGEIIAVGDGVSVTMAGSKVFSFHSHEGFFWEDPDNLLFIPDDIDEKDALFLPNMETAVNFVMDGAPIIGENIAVLGQGIVGLLTTSILNLLPLNLLITFDNQESRREASLAAGAFASFDPSDTKSIVDLDYGMYDGFDLTYEVSGNEIALDTAVQMTGYNGRVIVGSWYGVNKNTLDLGGTFHRNRIRMISSQVSSIDPIFQGRWTKDRRFSVVWDMIRKISPSKFISHEYSISEASVVYRKLYEEPGKFLQVIFEYGEGSDY